jgi:type II secretory pathway component HofQ
MKYLSLVFMIFLVGCQPAKLKSNVFDSLLDDDYGQFEQSEFRPVDLTEAETVKVTVRLDGLTVNRALLTLSDLTGEAIVWSQDLDDTMVSGYFQDVPLPSVLDSLSRRLGAEMTQINGVYYLGVLRPDDLATAVLAIPAGDSKTFKDAISGLLSDGGKLSVIGSSVIIRDTVESLRNIVNAIEQHKKDSLRRYVCELFFIRVREADLLEFGADLEIQSIDLLNSANSNELFNLLLTADASYESVKILQRPVIQVSEGLDAELTSGREIPLEQKSVSDSGTVETTGYETVTDGWQLSINVHRVSSTLLSVGLDLEVSTFDDVTTDSRPIKDAKTLSSNIALADSEVCLVGGIGLQSAGKSSGLFTIDRNSEDDTVLIWLRVRELRKI